MKRSIRFFRLPTLNKVLCEPTRLLKGFLKGLKEHLLVLMFPRHKVTSASLCVCLLLFVHRSTKGRAQRWCHHCAHCCAVWCPIFDQASQRTGQNVCLRTARRNSGLPALINTGSVFIGLKIILMSPPQTHFSLRSYAPQQISWRS